MEESPKHSLSILGLPHSTTAHLINCVSDLSSVRVVNFLCYVSSSSLGLCACVCCGFVFCVCCSPNLTLRFLCDLYCKGERLQVVEILSKRENTLKEKTVVFKLIIGSLERVECNPRPLGRHNMEVGKCYLAEPQDKIACLL
jgi:hypothetical protein